VLVKAIARDASFVDDCRGNTVKIIHALLPHIKVDREYRVVFMRQNLDEVLASQRKMDSSILSNGKRRMPPQRVVTAITRLVEISPL
jgi:hypothetical protein